MDGRHTRHDDSQTTRQRTTCQPARQKNKIKTDDRLRKFWRGELPGIWTDWKFWRSELVQDLILHYNPALRCPALRLDRLNLGTKTVPFIRCRSFHDRLSLALFQKADL